jgi:hypothetical protein
MGKIGYALQRSAATFCAYPDLSPNANNMRVAMTKGILKAGAVFALLLTSANAFADDPTGVLERERGYAPRYPGKLPAYSDSGPCYRGMQQESFPNQQGYRCVRKN